MSKIKKFSFFHNIKVEDFFILIYAFNKKDWIITQELFDHFPALSAGIGCIKDGNLTRAAQIYLGPLHVDSGNFFSRLCGRNVFGRVKCR